MNPPAFSSDHMLLFRGTGWQRDLSPHELQETMEATMAWFERLRVAGRLKTAQPLGDEGKIVSGIGGAVVSDGPFTESSEAIGGYLIVRVGSFDEALAIARTWPLLEHGASVEVRPVAAECASFQPARNALPHAGG